MGTINIFDLLIVLSGVYLIYTAIVMKKSGKITGGIVVSKDVNTNKMRDKEGFIKYMFGKVLVMGILTCLLGAVGIITDKLDGPVYISLIGIGCFMVILIIFAVASNKAKKMFID